jgi:hypothetical protein
MLSMAPAARANWVNGKVYCDSNFSGTIDAGDSPIDGVWVRATSLTAQPGQIFSDISGDPGLSPFVPGFYQVSLIPRIDNWRVELSGPGLPAGATLILPTTGFFVAHIDPSSPLTNHVGGLDFLLDCDLPPLCTDASCDDHNPCTDDHCDPHVGCSHTNNTASCSDDDACTTPDVCANGQCQPGAPLVCDDGNVCTDDTCDPAVGCVYTNNSAPCDDGNACTTNDVCADGQCVPGPPKNCDDGNPCNGIEICLPDTGCGPGPPPYLVKTQGRFGNLATINADIGANDADAMLRMGRNAHMPDGTNATGDMLSLGNGTSIYQAFTNKLNTGAGAIVRYSTGPATLPIEEPFCVIPTLTCGGPDTVVGVQENGAPLAPGSYGRLVIGTGGSIILDGGAYQFCSIKTARAAAITVKGTSASTIDVAGNVLLADQGTLALDSGTPPPTVRISGTSIRFGAGSDAQLIMLAPNAHLSLGRDAHVTGSFCVESASTDKHILLDCPPLPPFEP